MPNTDVKKMLSPQEMAVVDNISSLAEELRAMNMGNGQEVEMADAPMMDEERNDQMMMEKRRGMYKEMTADPENDILKADMGPNADPETRAEERVEDGTVITEGNYSEVGKALASISKSLQVLLQRDAPTVQKAAVPSATDATAVALQEITNVLKSVTEHQQQHDLAMANMLDVFGLDKAVQKAKPAEAPVGDLSANAVLKELAQSIQNLNNSNNHVQQQQQWGGVQKSQRDQLRTALPHILGSK